VRPVAERLGVRLDEGRAALRDLKARGADFIKVLSRLDRERYFAIATEAKRRA